MERAMKIILFSLLALLLPSFTVNADYNNGDQNKPTKSIGTDNNKSDKNNTDKNNNKNTNTKNLDDDKDNNKYKNTGDDKDDDDTDKTKYNHMNLNETSVNFFHGEWKAKIKTKLTNAGLTEEEATSVLKEIKKDKMEKFKAALTKVVGEEKANSVLLKLKEAKTNGDTANK